MILTLLQTDYIVLRAVNIVFSTMHEESINSAFRSSTLIKKQEAICAILVLLRASPASTSSGARRKKEANLICNVWQLICKCAHWQFFNGPASDYSSTDFQKNTLEQFRRNTLSPMNFNLSIKRQLTCSVRGYQGPFDVRQFRQRSYASHWYDGAKFYPRCSETYKKEILLQVPPQQTAEAEARLGARSLSCLTLQIVMTMAVDGAQEIRENNTVYRVFCV